MIGSMSLAALNTVLKGKQSGADVSFTHVSTDTRTLAEGDLYVALEGENFDGNEFTLQAFKKGACGAIVSTVAATDKPLLCVADTTAALGVMGSLNRMQSSARVVAVTGSQGKTTVKEMLGAILGVSNKVLVTRSNFNNHIGVPLTLLELDATHEYAVIELGASGLGEIAYTVSMTKPHVAVITNAAATHLEGFGDLQGVVRTKGEIIDGLVEGGVAVLNADDPNFPAWRHRAASRRVVSFGLAETSADYRAAQIKVSAADGVSFTLCTASGDIPVHMALAGLHNVANATAAAAAAMEAGATLAEVQTGLGRVRPVAGRLDVMQGLAGSVLIDDSYNASPSSFHAAIDVLSAYPGLRILIVGDMAELADHGESAHTELGRYALARGIDGLWSVGRLSALAAQAFGSGGEHFESQARLVDRARTTLAEGVVVLVKGSRSAAMDRVVEQLKNGVAA